PRAWSVPVAQSREGCRPAKSYHEDGRAFGLPARARPPTRAALPAHAVSGSPIPVSADSVTAAPAPLPRKPPVNAGTPPRPIPIVRALSAARGDGHEARTGSGRLQARIRSVGGSAAVAP